MTKLSGLLLSILFVCACASSTKAEAPADNFIWLEEIEGKTALEWVGQQNKKAVAELESDRRYKKVESDIHKILTAKDRIPFVALRNGELYNFWQDNKNVRGIWRKTSINEYKKKSPKWDVILDIDQLAKKENENWVWKGSNCLPPEMTRCLLSLSRGGKDAIVVREFDVNTRKFVADGFNLPEAKTGIAWKDQDTLFVGTDFGPGSLTDSGYPAQAREWKRGTPVGQAKLIYKCEKTDVSCRVSKSFAPEGDATYLVQSKSFFSRQYFRISDDLKITKLDVPEDAEMQQIYKGFTLFALRSPWKGGGIGDLVALDESGRVTTLLKASDRGSIQGVERSRDALYVTRLENVIGQVDQLIWDGTSWHHKKMALPEMGSADIVSVSAYEEAAFFRFESFLIPSSLYMSTGGLTVEKIKSIPQRFNSKNLVVEQFEATSRDGTKIPYFMVRSKNAQGPVPTLLYGYGGFEVSETPFYPAGVGKGWLERGGAYAQANIRGGGEFGPKWHQAALKEKRQVSYDDFIAVAEDMIQRGFTTPKQLGIRGGSNGGLLTGAVFIQRPDLFSAVVSQVPLLDMLRYNKLLAGASWMAEYGDPAENKIREFWLRTSPYQNIKAGMKYPRAFFSTSTKDDRVHPGHARKMVARLMEHGHPVLYFENVEGGHSAAANLKQRARQEALNYVYLYRQLMQ